MNEIQIGPYHPHLPGLFHLSIKMEGEICKKISPTLGFQHRSFEKIAEQLPYPSILPYIDRLDYLSSMNNELPYVMAVEKLLDLQIPKRAEYIRVIMVELNRIASHLFFISYLSKVLGSHIPEQIALNDRETILDIFEMACGSRLLYNALWIGGVWKDLTPGIEEKIRDFCPALSTRMDDFDTLLTHNPVFIDRTAHIGVLNLETTLSYGITGPNLRASGKNWDLRKNMPYSIYPELDFSIPLGTNEVGSIGDSWNRYHVRVQEIQESLKMIQQCLEKIPEGPFYQKIDSIKPPSGEIFLKTENPRGELGFYVVSDGTTKPYRLKVMPPSLSAINCFPSLCQDVSLSDVFTIIASLDINMSEVDR